MTEAHSDESLHHLCELLSVAMNDPNISVDRDQQGMITLLDEVVSEPSSRSATKICTVFEEFDAWNPIDFVKQSLSDPDSSNTVQDLLEVQSNLSNSAGDHSPLEIETWVQNESSRLGLGAHMLLAWMIIFTILCTTLTGHSDVIEMKSADLPEVADKLVNLVRLQPKSSTSHSIILTNVTNYNLSKFERKIARTSGDCFGRLWSDEVFAVLVGKAAGNLGDCLVHAWEEKNVTLDKYHKHVCN